MKKSNLLLAVFAVVAVVSVAGAQQVKVDFDGKDKGENAVGTMRTVAFEKTATPINTPKAKTGKCQGVGMCENEATGTCYYCDGGIAAVPVLAVGTPREKSLNEILAGLSTKQKLLVFESLTFNKEGKLSSLYSKDIKEVLGDAALKEVFKKFGIDINPKKGAVRMVKDQWCVSPGTCGDSAGYSCTDNC